ncbi:MFS transporter [Microbulbifer sp. MCCC 1A16149]|uniref:MFS transporter n=1 Tax=Microbulbifer sp. MCCC 1A16149 TaxID=3411322 RepID=UPI003D0E3A0B
MSENKEIRLSNARLMAFVSPEAPLAAFIMVFFVFVPPFYASTLGLGLTTVGIIFAVTKLWDVVTDPIFGSFSDKWSTRWGRRRPWLVVAVPLLLVSIYMVFIPSGDSVTWMYLTFWLVILYIGWTLGSVSHVAWAAELSADYHERSRISGVKQGAALIGSVALMLIIALMDGTGEASEFDRLKLIGSTVMIALPLCVVAALWAAREPPARSVRFTDSRKTLGILLRNKPLRRVLAANTLLTMSAGSIAVMFLFYVEDVLSLGKWASFALIPWMLSGLLFLPLCMRLTRKLNKHRSLCVVLCYQLIVSFLFLVLPEGNVMLACIAFLAMGAVQAVLTYIPAAIMADVVDVDVAESGKQRTGLYMSMLQTSSKVASALAVGVSYPILSAVGFDGGSVANYSDYVLDNVRWVMTLLPGFMFILVVFIMWNFPLCEKRQIALRRQIDTAQSNVGDFV